MGMFSTIVLEKLFCPLCGVQQEKTDGQTKKGQLDLRTRTKARFDRDNPTLGYYKVRFGECTSCKHWIDIDLTNTSEEYANHCKQEGERMNHEMGQRALKTHPNHEYSYFDRQTGEPRFHTVWCPRCKDLGLERDLPSHEMDAGYLEVYTKKAKMDYDEWEKKAPEREESMKKFWELSEEMKEPDDYWDLLE